MTKIVLLYATAPDAHTARDLAGALVEARLAACANIFDAMTSVYRWKGEIEKASETALIVKTTEEKAAAARELICARHPYDTPCVVALNVDATHSNPAFLDWIAAETAG